MKKFKFRLETILKQREAREEAALRQLALAQRSHQEALAERRKLEDILAHALDQRETLGRTPMPVVAFKTADDHIIGTKQRIIRSQQAISRSMRGVEKALRAYLLARRETGIMTNLREKEFLAYKKENSRLERKESEDLVTMRARFSETDFLSDAPSDGSSSGDAA